MIAGLLSGVMPGLGQLYCRQWARGVICLGAFSVADYATGISQGLIDFLMTRALPEHTAKLALGAIFMMAVAAWSVIDAVHTARESST